jgi:hypothetical protein
MDPDARGWNMQTQEEIREEFEEAGRRKREQAENHDSSDTNEDGAMMTRKRQCCGMLAGVIGDCLLNGTVEVNGKWYCYQHDPAVATRKAQLRLAARIAHEQEMEAEWNRKRAEEELNARRLKLIELVRGADGDGGKVFIKPAGQKAKQCFCIPVDRWMEIRSLLGEIPEEVGHDNAAINPYDRTGIDE